MAVISARGRLAAGVLFVGIAGMWLAQQAPATTAPLFDGVFVEDPYRYVNPPPGGAGDPQPVQITQPAAGGTVPLIALATSEVPPQAQIIAEADAFDLAGATAITLSIAPVAPNDPQVAGNVYRFSATGEAGEPLSLHPGALVTVVLRAPQAGAGFQVAHLGDAGWTLLPTDHGGLPDLFSANITALGDYAVVLAPTASASPAGSLAAVPSASPAPSGAGNPPPRTAGPPWLVIILGIAAVAVGLLWGVIGGEDR